MTSRKKKFWFAVILWGIIVLPTAFLSIMLSMISNERFGKMPSFEELENPKSNAASEVYSEDRKLLGTFHIENRSFVAFEDISPNLIKAVIATEDARFSRHSGIDMVALGRVLVRTISLGDRSQGGGSTITQQLAKQLFPRDSYDYRNPFQKYGNLFIIKLKEWITAVKLERNYTKNEIVAMYLNVVPFGSNAFGISAAAATFFNKAPSQLLVEEAALLAGVINAPTRYSPVRNYYPAMARRNFVMRQMVRAGYLGPENYALLNESPINLKYQQQDHNTGLATYFRERLRQTMNARQPERQRYATRYDYLVDSLEWEQNPLYGWCSKNRKPGGEAYDVNRDGLKIYTTINSKMQQYAEEALTDHLKNTLQPALDEEIKWKGGRVFGNNISKEDEQMFIERAIKQTERYRVLRNAGFSWEKIMNNFRTPTEMTIFNWQGEGNEVEVKISPLDSLKYYKALLRASFMAMNPHTGHIKAYVGGPNFRHFKYDMVRQGKRQIGSTIKPFLYTIAMQEGLHPCHKVPNIPQTFAEADSSWTPRNASPTSMDGKMVTLKWGLSLSVNYISAWLIKQFNPQNMVDLCHKMGIESYIPPVNSIFLGTAEVSLHEMVNAYATYANKGVRVMPMMVTRIEDRNGNVLTSFGNAPKVEAISEQTAYLMTNLLQAVVNNGTAIRLRGMYSLPGQIGGKTGTTQSQADGWFMGITPQLAAGAWVGCEDRTVHFESLRTGGGSGSALPIFGLFMQKVYADKSLDISPEAQFEAPLNLRAINLDCNTYEENAENPLLDSFGKSKQKKKVDDEFF
ncbi:MAG: transglycosylase domain-containing protein [Prevotellaceae bacterium]|jgi:penicillin-binding protein 1A|nr:transglycosylase domain-containing protein [Prevotellaceae bacterium]